MTYASNLALERLREVLDYDQESGLWTWRVATSTCVRVGQIAGAIHAGYVVIRVDGVLYRSHRLAWLYMTGSWPREIDHINGVRADNRWENLREATRSQNSANKMRIKEGKKGAYLNKRTGRWVAAITYNYEYRYLGTYDTEGAAHSAYLAEAQKLFGEYASGGDRGLR